MQNVNLNLIPGSVLPVVNVSQYDVGRHFTLTVYEGATAYSLTGKGVQIRGTKPDGNGFAYDSTDGAISVSNNVVTVSTLQQMTACGGQVMCELRITSGSDVLGTINFILDCEPSALSDDTPISDTDIPAIERDFQAALDEAEADALIAEGYAKGTQDGVPATSGEPYYQDNAKYYKEQAEAAASGGGADALKAEGYAVGTQNGTPVSSGSPYYQNNAKYYEGEAATSASNASTSETNAGLSETAAGNSASAAAADALKSEGFAIGEQNGTPVSSGSPYYQNNAKYYKEQAALYAGGGLHFMASVAFASIPTTGMVNGDMYNITDSFTTDSRFVEGAGKACDAGTNIAWVDSVSKWDVLAPGGGSGSLSGLSDVTITSASSDQILKFDGSKWVNGQDALAKLSDVGVSYPANGSPLIYNQTSQKWVNGSVIPYRMSELQDTEITTPSSGQFLKYDGSKWVNGNGGGGASALDDLTDVDITTPSDGEVLTYDSTSQKWVNAAGGGGGGFSYKAWLQAANISPSGFADLAAVLADEETVRHLMTVHDSVDYLTGFAASDANIQTILNDNYAAKWINLRDYALDTLEYAFSAVMASAGKYGYGEWAYINNTWQPKGNVPIMTSNSAPYGVASAYQVFDGNSATTASATDFSYQFTNPVCPKSFDCLNTGGQTISGGTLQGSNDGSTWETPHAGAYYLYLRVHFASSTTVATVQFYGRTLSVSVPTMTANDAPWGVASASSVQATSRAAWYSFDKKIGSSNDFDMWSPSNNTTDNYIIYEFPFLTLLKEIVVNTRENKVPSAITFTFYGSVNGTDWSDALGSFTCPAGSSKVYSEYHVSASSKTPYKYYKMFTASAMTDGSSWACNPQNIEYFCENYSEYDWDTDTPRHYLYDHGVELETIATSGTVTKGADALTLSAANAQATATVNLTNYDLLRGVVGQHFSGTTQLIAATTATGNMTAGNAPYNEYLDISNVSASLATGAKMTSAGVCDVAEMWLE